MAVYPPRMAPFGFKLWENAFQMIPDISFFDVRKKKSMNIFDNFFGGTIFANFFSKCLFLKRYDILDVTGSCSSKNDPRGFEIQPSAALGGGVKRSVYVFWLDIWRQNTFKKTYNSSKSVGFFFKKNLHNKKTYAY